MRLDILIYGHDGRGLGHISRSAGIGLALRRMFPRLKVLFVSGSAFTGELIGNGPLDWIKLPSYKTRVVGGKSVGVNGDSGFSDRELGILRSRQLRQLVQTYQPRLVLADHSPQGKHRELLEALDAAGEDCKWVLGVRGVIGDVSQLKGDVASETFSRYYSGLLWYGDAEIIGNQHLSRLAAQYRVEPVECGYVCRLQEYLYVNKNVQTGAPLAGAVSVPWLGEKSISFLYNLFEALQEIPESHGDWLLFVDTGESSEGERIKELFSKLKNCRIVPPGSAYVHALMHAKSAVIYGGYNSLVDVLFAGVPSLVLLREMQDMEQQLHVASLLKYTDGLLSSLAESEASADVLADRLLANLEKTIAPKDGVKIDGAGRAASYLYSRLQER